MWSCLGKEKDPFVVIPAFPIKEEFKDKWSKKRIRNEIFDAETGDIMQVNPISAYSQIQPSLLRILKPSSLSVKMDLTP